MTSPAAALAGSGPRAVPAFLTVVAGGTLLRVLIWALIWRAPFASDANDYLGMARQLLDGRPFVPYWPPGIPLLLAQLLRMGLPEPSLRILPLAFWLLCCWALYRLASTLGYADIAWVILLVFSLLPDTIQMSLEPMTQMSAAALLLLALGAALRLERFSALSPRFSGALDASILGLSLGSLCLVRPSAAVLLLILPAACIFFRRRSAPVALLACLLAVLIVGSWISHAHRMTGHWVINTANSVNLYYGNNCWTPLYRTWYFGSHAKLGSPEIAQYPEYAAQLRQVHALPELARPAVYQSLAISSIVSHPGTFVVRTVNRTLVFFGFDTFTSAALSRTRLHGLPLSLPTAVLEACFYLLLIVPSLFYIAAAPGRFWRESTVRLLASTLVLYSLPYWLSMSHPTYHFPILLVCAVLGAFAWKHSSVREPAAIRRGWFAVALLLLIQVEWGVFLAANLRHGG